MVLDLFSKYGWIVPLKDKKGVRYGTKSPAVGSVNKLPTMMKDVRVSGWFFPTFAQIIR